MKKSTALITLTKNLLVIQHIIRCNPDFKLLDSGGFDEIRDVYFRGKYYQEYERIKRIYFKLGYTYKSLKRKQAAALKRAKEFYNNEVTFKDATDPLFDECFTIVSTLPHMSDRDLAINNSILNDLVTIQTNLNYKRK